MPAILSLTARLNETFAPAVQFTAPANMADPSTMQFEMGFRPAHQQNMPNAMTLSSSPGGGLSVSAMNAATRTFVVAARVLNIAQMIPPGTYIGYLKFTDPTGYSEELLSYQYAVFTQV